MYLEAWILAQNGYAWCSINYVTTNSLLNNQLSIKTIFNYKLTFYVKFCNEF